MTAGPRTLSPVLRSTVASMVRCDWALATVAGPATAMLTTTAIVRAMFLMTPPPSTEDFSGSPNGDTYLCFCLERSGRFGGAAGVLAIALDAAALDRGDERLKRGLCLLAFGGGLCSPLFCCARSALRLVGGLVCRCGGGFGFFRA